MNVFELLERDHREVDELFRRFSLSDRPESLEELSRQIVHDLSVHAAVEELFVYPLLRTKVSEEAADHAIEEHAGVKRLLADVEKLDVRSAEHRNTMSQIIESVRHHVEEEEDEIFGQLRSSTSTELQDKLGVLVDKAKGMVPTHPHPLVPGTATAQLVAGPWAAVVDRIRDLLH